MDGKASRKDEREKNTTIVFNLRAGVSSKASREAVKNYRGTRHVLPAAEGVLMREDRQSVKTWVSLFRSNGLLMESIVEVIFLSSRYRVISFFNIHF